MAVRYRLRLHVKGLGELDASVDGANRWRLPEDIDPDPAIRQALTEAVADVVESSLMVGLSGDYMPVYDMRYAIQALTAFPGSEPLFTVPFEETEGPRHY